MVGRSEGWKVSKRGQTWTKHDRVEIGRNPRFAAVVQVSGPAKGRVTGLGNHRERKLPIRIPPFVCAACAKQYSIGDDAVAVCLEFGLPLPSFYPSRDPAFREDLVSSIRNLPFHAKNVLIQRAQGSWEIILRSLSAGEIREWICDECQSTNGYQLTSFLHPSLLLGKSDSLGPGSTFAAR
jgi:hypothetical protein